MLMRKLETEQVNSIAQGLRKGFAATAREPLPERIKELVRRLDKASCAKLHPHKKQRPRHC